ncbi:MAG: DUF2283 domain-containing protein [Nitrospirae bacterium]|nr:DUF2283 domain-containing protein [Nitrospirota bacterium]
MKLPKAFYDSREDILYLGKPGNEEEYVEIQPGVNIELDSKKKIIGIEVLQASKVLKDVIAPLAKRIQAA